MVNGGNFSPSCLPVLRKERINLDEVEFDQIVFPTNPRSQK